LRPSQFSCGELAISLRQAIKIAAKEQAEKEKKRAEEAEKRAAQKTRLVRTTLTEIPTLIK
jgi:hypothetical protein